MAPWLGLSPAVRVEAVGQADMGEDATAVATAAEKVGTVAQKVPFEQAVELQGGEFEAQPEMGGQGSGECRALDPLAGM